MKRKARKANAETAQSGRQLSAREMHSLLIKAEGRRRSGHLEEAEQICRQLLSLHPTYLGALQTFGLISLEKKNFPQAMNCFLTAAAEAPTDWTNFTNLAAAWLGLEVPQMAAVMLREAKSLNPEDAEVHFMLGEVFNSDREYEQAMEAYRQALSLDPDHKLALLKLSDCLINLGYFLEAKTLLIRLHGLRPDSIAVINLLLQLPQGSTSIDFRRAIDGCRAQDTETKQEYENNRQFVLASILDREGCYKEAWTELQFANSALEEEHKQPLEQARERRNRDLQYISTLIKHPSRSATKSSSNVAHTPLFILGPSRSGKTTLETLVGSHPEVKRGYENHMVETAVKRASQIAGLVTISSLQILPEPLHLSFAHQFRIQLSSSAGRAKVVTNTNPGLIGSVAKLAMALPEARFVFLTRDSDDTSLRIFMKKYNTGNHHAYNLKSAREYVEWYNQMIKILSLMIPERTLMVRYEEMVINPQSTAQSVFRHCGLSMRNVSLPQIGSDVGAAKPYERLFLI